MKKLIMLLGIMFLLSTPVFAEFGEVIVEQNVDSTGLHDMAVSSTDTLYTRSFSKQKVENMTLMYKATSTGAVDVSIYLLQSFTKPTTEGTLDSRYATTDTIVASLDDEVWHIATLDTITALPFGVYQITGNGSNDASTTVEIQTCKQ
jgi:uncharacterized membrane protein